MRAAAGTQQLTSLDEGPLLHKTLEGAIQWVRDEITRYLAAPGVAQRYATLRARTREGVAAVRCTLIIRHPQHDRFAHQDGTPWEP